MMGTCSTSARRRPRSSPAGPHPYPLRRPGPCRDASSRGPSNVAGTIVAMYRRSFLRSCLVLSLITLMASSASFSQDSAKRGRKYKAPPPTSKIEVTVLKGYNGKPIENAAVIFHTLNESGNDSGNMELKSDEDGKAMIDVLPIGETVRLQIIAKGYQTYGGDYKIEKDQMAIEVRMKRPGEQYSVYKPHPEDKGNSEQNKDQDKDKPSDTSKPQ